MDGINALIAQGVSPKPTWDLFTAQRNALANQRLGQEVSAFPEEQNWLRKSRGWAEEDRTRVESRRPFEEHQKALGMLVEEGDMISYDMWDDSKSFLEKYGLRPGLLPSRDFFERSAPKGVSPEEYFEAWKESFIGKSKRQLEGYKAETERFKATKEAQSAPEKQMRDYEIRKKAILGRKIEKIKTSLGPETTDEEAEEYLAEADKKMLENLKATFKIGEKHAVEKPPTPTELAKLIEEYNNLAPNDPNRSFYQAAIAKKVQSTGMQVTVDKDGTVRVTQGPIGAGGELTKPTETKVQEEMVFSMDQLQQLEEVGKSFSREFLTYKGRGKRFVLNQMSRLEDVIGPLKQKDRDFVARSRGFTEGVEQFFNRYRKEITGAQAVMKELEMLRDSVLNRNLSPDEFETSFNRMINQTKRSLRLKQMLIKKGFSGNELGKMLDKEFMAGNDAPVSATETSKGPGNATTTPGGTETKTIDGKTYIKVNGQWYEGWAK